MSFSGLSLAEREAMRRKYRDKALAQAARMGVTLRCRRHLDDLDHPDHQLCRGELPGGAGCLCCCHFPEERALQGRILEV